MKEISTNELKKLMDSSKEYTLLDCRGADYFNWESIPTAINLRYKYIKDKAEDKFPDKDALIITYCDGFTCNASVRCYENLKKAGYTNILEYSGGVADWKAHGHETIINTKHRIAPNVYRFPNQTFYSEKVGSYMIVDKDFALLIDGPMQLSDEHEDFIRHQGKSIKIFLSHGPTGGETKKLQEKYKAEIYLHNADKNSSWLTVKPDVLFTEEFDFSDNLHVIHTPGHSPGSSVVYDSKNKILFTGDHVQGESSISIYDFVNKPDANGDGKQRLKSAKKLLKYDFDAIYPFHYKAVPKNAKNVLTKFIKNTT